MIKITSSETYIIIDGSVYSKNSFSLSQISNGVRVLFSNDQYLDVNINNVELDGVAPGSVNDLTTFLTTNGFSLNGGGDGSGSQNKGATYTGTDPLFTDDLNIMYPDAGDRFIVVATNVGSGMLYVKIIAQDQAWWYSWAASLAVNN